MCWIDPPSHRRHRRDRDRRHRRRLHRPHQRDRPAIRRARHQSYRTMGLARSFRDGVDFALVPGRGHRRQHRRRQPVPADGHPRPGAPILAGRADMVIGDRQTAKIEHFSPFKKRMQRFGSAVVNKAARTELPDAASGFRAYSRASLYPTERRHAVQLLHGDDHPGRQPSAEDRQRPDRDQSRRPANRALFKNIWHHMFKSGVAITRSYLMFRPYILLATLGTIFGVLGLVPVRPVRCAVAVRRGQRAHPVADLRHVDVRRLTAVFRAADHRGPVADQPDHARGEPGAPEAPAVRLERPSTTAAHGRACKGRR